jgi:hypothetical protein
MRSVLVAVVLASFAAGQTFAQEQPQASAASQDASQKDADRSKPGGCACCEKMAMNKPKGSMDMETPSNPALQ